MPEPAAPADHPPPPADAARPDPPGDTEPPASGHGPLRQRDLPVFPEDGPPITARAATWLDRLSPGGLGARALAVVGVLAVLLAGGYLWLSRPRPHSLTGDAPISPAAAAPTSQTGPAAPGLVVHVAGKVRKPGVVTLPAGARVADAIQAAGGLRPGADTGSLNLARRVVDGEQLRVGLPAPTTVAAQPEAAPPNSQAPGGLLDLNTATVEQLETLPGVGPVLAQRIIEYRTRNGGFRSVEQLQDVSGIGERRYADLRTRVRA